MDKKQIKKTLKKVQYLEDPEIAKHDELLETNEHLEDISEKLSKPLKLEKGAADSIETMASFLSKMKGEEGDKGDKGDKGERGEKGDSIQGEKGDKGDNGIDGKDAKDGRDGRDGYTPIKGVDYFDGKNGRDGRDGRDGKNTDVKTVVEYLKTLKGSDRIPLSAISESELMMRLGSTVGKKINTSDERWHGGGLTKVSTDATLTGEGTPDNPLTVVGGGEATWYTGMPAGTKNGINDTFTLPDTPISNSLFLFLNGQYLTENIDYTLVANTITMDTPPFDDAVFTYKYTK